MTILFLTMSRMTTINERGIYTDLMRYFRDAGNNVYIVSPRERSLNLSTGLVEVDGVHILGVQTLNLQKTSVIEKGVGQILIEAQFKSAIRKFFKWISFDLILYSTPPITFPRVISYSKRLNPNAITYLLLKDIFPQNAIDIGMMCKNGLKGILYNYFRRKEKELYRLSDFIGCMSPANVVYIRKHNLNLQPEKVEIAPNSIQLVDYSASDTVAIRTIYNLPLDRPVFIYGGNLGKPQGIPYLIDCLKANANRNDCFIVVIGTGTELHKLLNWYENEHPASVKVMEGLQKADYDEFVRACDVGLIFLDHRFTIPNFPSRLLSYLENKMPVLCATDPNTDIGSIAEDNGFGYWCESNSVENFTLILERMIQSDRKEMGEKGYEFLKKHYLVENTYHTIMSHV